MVDKPRISPQAFAKSTTRGVPTLSATTPNLRGTPSVTAFAQESVADTLVGLADDSNRLAALAGRQFDISQEQFEIAQAEVERNQELEAESTFAKARVEYQARLQELRQTMDVDQIPQATSELYDKVMAEAFESQDFSAYQREYLAPRVENEKTNTSLRAIEYQANLRQIEQENNARDSMAALSVEVFNDPKRYREKIAEAAVSGPMQKLSEPERQASMANVQLELVDSAVRGWADQEPATLEALLRNGEFDDLIDGETKAQYIDLAKSRQKKAVEKRTFEESRDLGLFRSRMDQDPYAVTDAEIQQASVRFNLSDAEIANMFTRRGNAKAKFDNNTTRVTRVMSIAKGDQPNTLSSLSAEDKADVDLAYETQVAAEIQADLEAGRPNIANTKLVNFIGEVGIVPTAVTEELVGQIRSGDATQKAQAIDVIERMRNDDRLRRVPLGIPVGDIAYLDRVSDLMRYKSDTEEAIRIAEQEQNMSTTEVRTKNFDKVFNPDMAIRQFDDVMDTYWFSDPDLPVVGGTKSELLADLRAAALESYLRNPTADKGMYRRAVEGVQHRYSVFDGDGTKRYMKDAPNRHMPPNPATGNHEYIKVQLHEDIKTVMPDAEIGDYFIVADDLTRGRISGGQAPSYQVWTMDEDGTVDQLMSNGVAQRFVPRALDMEQATEMIRKELELKKQQRKDRRSLGEILRGLD